MPPEAVPVSPASTFMATVSETSGPPGSKHRVANRRECRQAPTTAPKPTRLATVRIGTTEELAPASRLSRSEGSRR